MFQRSFSRNHTSNFRRRGPRSGSGRFGGRTNNGAPKRSSINPQKYVNSAQATPSTQEIAILHKFEDFQIDPILKRNIALRGYQTPTPIQDQAIPEILKGKDVIGIANTGTGKTAAFLVPLLHKIIQQRSERVLILVPTRELAVQIYDEMVVFARELRIFAALIMGGASVHRQVSDLRRNPSVVIATPGRLKDLIQRNVISLHAFRNVVLDEVDRMVDIGFIHDIKYIIAQLPSQRQSLFFSATVSSEINTLIQVFLRNPITISVKREETAKGIDQQIIKVKDKNEKLQVLETLLRNEEFKKVLIFGRTKWGVEKLSKKLEQLGFPVGSIHGNKSQNQRLSALRQFKASHLRILVATDVVARGLDIDDVSHVINYDEPSTYTDYVHRIGRTGRANKLGKALTFVG